MTDAFWLGCAVSCPLMGSLFVGRLSDPGKARIWTLLISGIALICSLAAWAQFANAPDPVGTPGFPGAWLSLDQLSAPLGPLASLLFLATSLVTLRTKIRRFSFAQTLFTEAVTLATLACREPWGIVVLLTLGIIPQALELRSRGQPVRVYLAHLVPFGLLLILGQLLEDYEGPERFTQWWASLPLFAAVLIRSGAFPFHLWVSDLFERASFGTALLFVTPMLGAYACVRLVIPVSPDWVLRTIALFSLFTAVYTAGLATVQTEARRFFCCLFLSHSALVLVGLEMVTEIGLTGALCIWLSVGLSLAGFGLTLRAIESRRGRVHFESFQGLYDHAPELALCFGLTGLACVGFPGTVGFVGTELLVDGVVEAYPFYGIAVVVACALNGIAIIRTYFRIFTGTRHQTSVSLRIRPREQIAVLLLSALILLGGIFPQAGVLSRYDAASDLLMHRPRELHSDSEPDGEAHSAPPQLSPGSPALAPPGVPSRSSDH